MRYRTLILSDDELEIINEALEAYYENESCDFKIEKALKIKLYLENKLEDV